jgi:hypothetical protein
VLPAVVEAVELLVAAGENSKPQEPSRDSTSPAALVTAIVGHENSDLDSVVNTVFVTVNLRVKVLVNVTNSMFVSKGVQEICLSHRTALRTASAAAALLVPVALGGLYESAQSVSSSSVAFWELVTVMGKQVKSLASSGSETSATVTVTTCTVVEVVVVVSISVAGGHAEQMPSEAQYAIERQHSSVQQVSAFGHAPFGQHISEVGM